MIQVIAQENKMYLRVVCIEHKEETINWIEVNALSKFLEKYVDKVEERSSLTQGDILERGEK